MRNAPILKRKQPLAPTGGNDKIYTPHELAKVIVKHFKPSGRILEPCKGDGAFTRYMPGCAWCEIDEGRDFFTHVGCYDWIVTNPPWGMFREFLKKSMDCADNVVFLCLINAWFMTARQRDIAQAGFGLVEILCLPSPLPPWPPSGFALGAGWLRRGWQGGTHFSHPTAEALAEIPPHILHQ